MMARMARPAALLLAVLGMALLWPTAHADSFSSRGIGMAETVGQVMAFGDHDSNKRTDIYVLSHDRKQVHVRLWRNGAYRESAAALVTETLPIESVVPSDFSHDGRMDLLVTMRSGNGTFISRVWVHGSKKDQGYLPTPVAVPGDSRTQLLALALDIKSQSRVCLFGQRASDGKRVIWENRRKTGASGDTPNFEFVAVPQDLSSLPQLSHTLYYPHASGFVDLDGDCLADLFVTSVDNTTGWPRFEIWVNRKSRGFEYHSSYLAPQGSGMVSFSDFNGDGTIDLLFPVCYPSDSCEQVNQIHIFYNEQKPMCSSRFATTSSSCRAQDDLCKSDVNFKFSSNWTDTEGDRLHVIVRENRFGDMRFLTGPAAPPITIRSGDPDLNGFPDILVPLTSGAQAISNIPQDAFVSFWRNVGCDGRSCPQASHQRTFSRAVSSMGSLTTLYGGYAGAFVDYSDNGGLDMLVLTADSVEEGNTTETVYRTHGLRGDFDADAFFMTTLGLNGVCPSWCPDSWGKKFPDPKPYGVNHPGVNSKFTVTTVSGRKVPRQGSQLSQSQHLALQTPYLFFGLGRTNNYIEEFHMGVPLNSKHSHMWVAIIPNSQLIMFPYKPTQPDTWTLELFISPSSSLVWVTVIWLLTLSGIGGLIVYLHWKEKKEDEQEKQKEHLYAF